MRDLTVWLSQSTNWSSNNNFLGPRSKSTTLYKSKPDLEVPYNHALADQVTLTYGSCYCTTYTGGFLFFFDPGNENKLLRSKLVKCNQLESILQCVDLHLYI